MGAVAISRIQVNSHPKNNRRTFLTCRVRERESAPFIYVNYKRKNVYIYSREVLSYVSSVIAENLSAARVRERERYLYLAKVGPMWCGTY